VPTSNTIPDDSENSDPIHLEELVMSAFEYAEYAIGGVQNRNRIHRSGDFHLNGNDTDCFRSVFLFGETLAAWVKRTGSVSGFVGPHTADALLFDFDGEDLDAVRAEVEKFVLHIEALHEVPRDAVRLAFSGQKGFHFVLPFSLISEDPRAHPDFWQAYKAMALELCDGFAHLDRSIYEPRRLFRLMNTKHGKSGLYKIPLTFDELADLAVEKIQGLAKEPRKIEVLPISEISPVPVLEEMWEQWNNHFRSKLTIPTPTKKRSRSDLVGMLQGKNEGERNNAAIRLAGLLLAKNVDRSGTLEILRLWNERNTPSLGEEELTTLVERAHRRYAKKDTIPQVYDLRQAGEAYAQHVKELKQRRVQLGFQRLDEKTRGILPGEVLALVAKTSNGKTALALSMARNFARTSGQPVLFFSLEMPLQAIYERTYQLEMDIAGYEVEEQFRVDEAEVKRRIDVLFGRLPTLYFIPESGLTLSVISAAIRHCEEHVYGKRTGLVLIDYLSLVRGERDYHDEYLKTTRIARSIKDLAKARNVPVIFLSQVTKAHGISDELALDSGRDSGAIAEAADFVLGLWRKKKDENKRKLSMTLAILKNRRGGLGEIPVNLDRKTLSFAEVKDPGIKKRPVDEKSHESN